MVDSGDDGMRRMATGFVALSLAVAVAAGCSSPAAEPAGPTASTSPTTAAPTATPTEAPTAATGVIQDLSDPALGVVFEAAPALTGDDADVYNWIATFEKESWRTKATSVVSPAMDVIASPEVRAQVQSASDTNKLDASVFGGVITVRIGAISVDGDAASGTACRDFATVTFTNADGPDTPEQAGFGQPRLLELTLARVPAENRWTVQTLKENGTC